MGGVRLGEQSKGVDLLIPTSERSQLQPPPRRRTLVAGIGNVLRGDDGFGPAVAKAVEADPRLPPSARCIELGIGGIGLVHELMAGIDRLIVVDAVDRGGKPGTMYVLQPQVPDSSSLSDAELHTMAGDMHHAVPGQTLTMAAALGVLPATVWLIGCQPAETEELSLDLTPLVAQAVPQAVEMVLKLILSPHPSSQSRVS